MTSAEIGCFIDYLHDHYGDIWTEDQVKDSHYADMSLSDAIAEESSICEMHRGNVSALFNLDINSSDSVKD